MYIVTSLIKYVSPALQRYLLLTRAPITINYLIYNLSDTNWNIFFYNTSKWQYDDITKKKKKPNVLIFHSTSTWAKKEEEEMYSSFIKLIRNKENIIIYPMRLSSHRMTQHVKKQLSVCLICKYILINYIDRFLEKKYSVNQKSRI